MTSIDPLRDQLLSLRDAAAFVPGRPHLRTIWRWVLTGIDGCKLETVRIGRLRFTTREAVADFLSRLNAPRSIPEPRRRRAQQARKRLKEMTGI